MEEFKLIVKVIKTQLHIALCTTHAAHFLRLNAVG